MCVCVCRDTSALRAERAARVWHRPGTGTGAGVGTGTGACAGAGAVPVPASSIAVWPYHEPSDQRGTPIWAASSAGTATSDRCRLLPE